MSDEARQGYPDYFSRSQFPTAGYIKRDKVLFSGTAFGTVDLKTFDSNAILDHIQLTGHDISDFGFMITIKVLKFDGANDLEYFIDGLDVVEVTPFFRGDNIFKVVELNDDLRYVIIELKKELFLFPSAQITFEYFGLTGSDWVAELYYKEYEK